MNKANQRIRDPNQYDKIVKENLEITLPVIIRDMLGLDIAHSEELPDDVQHTKERKPDALKKVRDASGNSYILHIEFQTSDEKGMVYRMAEYSIMLMRKYKLPIKQYVIFLKDATPRMPVFIDTEKHKFSFTLIRIAEANYRLFLRADTPEIKMLGILANFGNEDHNEAIKQIVTEIYSETKSELDQSRYFNQMRIFVQLRKGLEHKFESVMQSVSTFFKEENDYLFRRGERKGEVKGTIEGERKGNIKGQKLKTLQVLENLIIKLGLSDEQAALGAGVDISEVEQFRAQYESK